MHRAAEALGMRTRGLLAIVQDANDATRDVVHREAHVTRAQRRVEGGGGDRLRDPGAWPDVGGAGQVHRVQTLRGVELRHVVEGFGVGVLQEVDARAHIAHDRPRAAHDR
jgi:hypothetical protein